MTTFRNWKYDAVQFVREFAQSRGMWFTTEDVRWQAWADGFPKPDAPQWWGQVMQEAADLGIIENVVSPSSGMVGWSAIRRHYVTLWRKPTHA